MKQIIVQHKKPTEIVDIVTVLRGEGMVQGKDFDFAFHNATYNLYSHEAVEPRHTVFTFYNDSDATMFALRFL